MILIKNNKIKIVALKMRELTKLIISKGKDK